MRTLGRQTLTVASANPGGGTVSGPGILCGSTCSAAFNVGTPVGLTATPAHGFAFAGFSGACSGGVCNLVMDGPKTTTADFYAFGFGKVKARSLRKGRAWLRIKTGGPGRVVVFGKKIKQRGKNVRGAGAVTLPIIAKGKTAKALNRNGKAKVGVRLAFIPSAGVKSNLSRPLTLRKKHR